MPHFPPKCKPFFDFSSLTAPKNSNKQPTKRLSTVLKTICSSSTMNVRKKLHFELLSSTYLKLPSFNVR